MKSLMILTVVVFFTALTVPFLNIAIFEKKFTPEADHSVTQATEATENTTTKIVELIQTASGEVKEIDLFEYIVGVVAGEMPASFSVEALKAQAVACYTYTKYIKEQQDNTDNGVRISDSPQVHQSYIDKANQKEKWGENYDEYRIRIENAVSSVFGEYVSYNGKSAMTVFHASSQNATVNALDIWGEDVPYLKSVNSYEDNATQTELCFYAKEFKKLFTEKGQASITETDAKKWAQVIEKTENGFIKKLKVGNKTFTFAEVRAILDLPGNSFRARLENESFIFTVFGKGHGVGMCQTGAEKMALQGKSYKEILEHYYPGTVIRK